MMGALQQNSYSTDPTQPVPDPKVLQDAKVKVAFNQYTDMVNLSQRVINFNKNDTKINREDLNHIITYVIPDNIKSDTTNKENNDKLKKAQDLAKKICSALDKGTSTFSYGNFNLGQNVLKLEDGVIKSQFSLLPVMFITFTAVLIAGVMGIIFYSVKKSSAKNPEKEVDEEF